MAVQTEKVQRLESTNDVALLIEGDLVYGELNDEFAGVLYFLTENEGYRFLAATRGTPSVPREYHIEDWQFTIEDGWLIQKPGTRIGYIDWDEDPQYTMFRDKLREADLI